jgi:hypothetical protein
MLSLDFLTPRFCIVIVIEQAQVGLVASGKVLPALTRHTRIHCAMRATTRYRSNPAP